MNAIDYPDLRAAYCAYYRVLPERFERSAFWRTLGWHAVLPVLLTGGRVHSALLPEDFFARDLEHLTGVGECRSEQELTRALDSIGWDYTMERDRRRSWLRLRLSLRRVDDLFRPFLAVVRAPLAAADVKRVEAGAEPVAGPVRERSFAEAPELRPAFHGKVAAARATGPQEASLLRKLERVHAQIVTGRSWETVLMEAGLAEDEFDQLLEHYQGEHSQFAWLRSQFRRDGEFRRLRAENVRLTRMLTELSLRLSAPKSGEESEPGELGYLDSFRPALAGRRTG